MIKPIDEVEVWYHGSRDHNSYPLVEFSKLEGQTKHPATFLASDEETSRDYAKDAWDGYNTGFGVVYAVKVKDLSKIFDFRLLFDEDGDLTPFGEDMVDKSHCFEYNLDGIREGDWNALEECYRDIKYLGFRGYVEGTAEDPDLALFYPHEDAEIIDGYRIFVGGDDREGPQDVTLFPEYLKLNGKPTPDRKNVFFGDFTSFFRFVALEQKIEKINLFKMNLAQMFGIPVDSLVYKVISVEYPEESWPTTIYRLKVFEKGKEPSTPNAQVVDRSNRDWSRTIESICRLY